jgi:hypothetical protein
LAAAGLRLGYSVVGVFAVGVLVGCAVGLRFGGAVGPLVLAFASSQLVLVWALPLACLLRWALSGAFNLRYLIGSFQRVSIEIQGRLGVGFLDSRLRKRQNAQ